MIRSGTFLTRSNCATSPLPELSLLDLQVALLSDLEARDLSSSNVSKMVTPTQAGLTGTQLH